jgi:hypothetical protein
VIDALTQLRDELAGLELGLDVPGAEEARRARDGLVAQVDDYLLPRLRQMDAPLLMVVGGSTGAGKSTLVNSLVGEQVSEPGVLRPTTRAPVLVCHPADLHWFEDDRILPGLSRTSGGRAAPGGLELVTSDRLPPGLALLDSPDIDSVVAANRALAGQLLAAADSWLFVTTAARYADAVPWDLLHAARDRGTALSLVLNRVPEGAEAEIAPHLRRMLAERGLEGTELLVVPETRLEDGRLPASGLAPVRTWLDALAADAQARAGLVQRTLTGALDSLTPRTREVGRVVEAQLQATRELRAAVGAAYAGGLDQVDEIVRSGSLLRGEVLARWHDVVGTGDLMRALESRVGWVRDRLRAVLTARPPADVELKAAVESSVDAVVHAAADRAAERAAGAWRGHPAGRGLIARAPRLDSASAALAGATRDEVRAWQGRVLDLVREEGADRRTTARLASLGVNGAGLVVMLGVFASTGGLTGAEVVVAGGTSAVGQKVLEAIFGDQAVRALAARAREDLLERVQRLLAGEAARFDELLTPLAPAPDAPERLRAALTDVERAR